MNIEHYWQEPSDLDGGYTVFPTLSFVLESLLNKEIIIYTIGEKLLKGKLLQYTDYLIKIEDWSSEAHLHIYIDRSKVIGVGEYVE